MKRARIKLSKNFIIVLFLSFVFFIFQPYGAFAAQDTKGTPPPKEKEAKSIQDVTKKAVDPGYLYDPRGKTDPFKSFIAVIEEKEEKEKKKPKTYLETLELSQLDLIVVAVGKKGRWAMVRDSKGIGHVIKEGTPIGTNGGVVHKIAEGEVVIREQFRDFRGQNQIRDISKKTPELR
ncbi:MAG: pilus assembly protein PilP [Deltaproteobacteria bacterium]|nr:pilus assembly protein PilP [Deltaproteobacteria bacterium]